MNGSFVCASHLRTTEACSLRITNILPRLTRQLSSWQNSQRRNTQNVVRSFALSWVRRVENNQQKEQIMARNTTYKNSSEAREVKSPAFIAWHVAEKSKDKSFWTRIGAAWDHEDGKG
jgi:hypothetical protein